MKIKGTVRKEDLGSGVFYLEAEDGTTYLLNASDPKLRKDGLAVEVEGKVDEGAAGIGMTGDPTLTVKTWKAR